MSPVHSLICLRGRVRKAKQAVRKRARVDTERLAESPCPKWRQQHTDMRMAEGIPENAYKYTNDFYHTDMGPRDGRCADLVNLAYQVLTKDGGSVGDSFVDISQSGSRKPWMTDVLRSVTTSSCYWSFSRRRCLLQPEIFRIMGFMADTDYSDLSVGQLQDLVGACMALPSVGLMLLSLMASLEGHWENC